METREIPQEVRLGTNKEYTIDEGRIPVHFRWETEPKTFGGYDQEGLEELSQKAADFFHVKPADREKIHVYFADHAAVTYPHGKSVTPGNVAIPGYRGDATGTVDDVTVVINRSKELYEEQNGISSENGNALEDNQRPDVEVSKYGFVGVTLQQPWEGVAWRVAEEINHASVVLKLGSQQKIHEASDKFKARVEEHHKDKAYIEPYSTNLLEVTAARQVLRFMKKLAEERAPDRIAAYEQALTESYTNRYVVLPGYDGIEDELYINTGYKSPKEEIDEEPTLGEDYSNIEAQEHERNTSIPVQKSKSK